MEAAEHDAVADLWFRAGKAAYPYLPGWTAMTVEQARGIFREHVAPGRDLYVIESDGAIAGYLAMAGSYVDRLYIDPACQGRGLGSALLAHARTLSPAGLELHTHVENRPARAFYEARGFSAVRFGISPPPESAPDVEYHWRP